MAFASALVFLSQENRDALVLAQGFSSNAMADFSRIMQIKSLRTLQCLLLLLLYSALSSSSALTWYISGLCSRMCMDLGLHSERTIAVSGKGESTEDEVDAKRRLFWVTYTFRVTRVNEQLAAWNDQALLLSDLTTFITEWWRYWYQNALLILHRPSPTISRPDPQTLLTCYSAAKSLIQLSFIRVHKGPTDFT
ncbi:hypothetical protein QQZ08_002687 [Neonectria magnoliae]|uniref:Xylanolytic transcriptional activator regulatory domain-containing protein n=1 Tax=Neonectria magnoliae TaxID=2732573 RepID=A0ABR1IB02_9HYPO